MIDNSAAELVRALSESSQLRSFNRHLLNWLTTEHQQAEASSSLTEHRARTLLLTTQFTDEATLRDFSRFLDSISGPRITTYELIVEADLVNSEKIRGFVALSAASLEENSSDEVDSWIALSIAAFSRKNGYPVDQFDPSNPPSADSPAGHVLKRTAQFIRRQIQRSATERDKLFQMLSEPPSNVPSLDELSPGDSEIAPAPPHYRNPIPVNYPEMSTDIVRLESEEITEVSSIEVGDPLVISSDEVDGDVSRTSEPTRQPSISIDAENLAAENPSPPSPLPSTAVVMPTSTEQGRSNMAMSIRQMFRNESMKTVKLRVIVQQYPDGPGLYGLQVRVTSKGIKSYVAGTTNREGQFLCELPVRIQSGLTYDVQVTWPRDVGGDVENKSITLNADRTVFSLPFYRQINPPAN